MSKITLIEAVNLAIHNVMAEHDNVVTFGEDVGTNGGVFRATDNLKNEFGEMRVFDTPLAEAMIAGLAVGMASQGTRPIAEIQFSGFIFPAMEHIICHMARMRNRTKGRLTLPLVVRAPYGGGIHAPEHHSESIEAIFAHTPGLRVVVPSTPEKAYRQLIASVEVDDPVIFLEPKRIYRSVKEDFARDGLASDITKADIVQEGTDLTVISWGAMLQDTLKAVQNISDTVSVEVIDLVSINPIDRETILASVKKTGKCVIVQEAARTCSVGSELSATINEELLTSLFAPVKRVSGYDITMPYFELEKKYMPSVSKIERALMETYNYDL